MCREKVVKEYQENVIKGVDMSEVNNFPYMRAVTRETNRRYGSAMHIRYSTSIAFVIYLQLTNGLLFRKAVKDTQLGDYFIPKGRLIAASSWVNGNDPDLAINPEEVRAYHIFFLSPLTDPLKWNPDRFFENQKFLQYFNPFGSGNK